MPRDQSTEVTAATLNAGARALMAWALTRRDDRHAPPGMLPYPDRHADGNYDSLADCPPNLGTAITNHALRLGRLPVAGEPIGTPCEGEDFGTGRRAMLEFDARDGNGDALWYAVSQNLLDDTRSRQYQGAIHGHRALTPAALRSPAASQQWLTICDAAGNLLSTDAAFVLISPGVPLAHQNRTTTAPGPGAFLDTLSLPAGTSPCRGSINHAASPRIFVAAPRQDRFNDTLIYISSQQFIDQLVVRAIGSFRSEIDRAAAIHPATGYPHPAAIHGGNCDPTIDAGFLPLRDQGSCAGLAGWPRWDAHDDPTSWYASLHYRRVSHTEAHLSVVGCNDVFVLRRHAHARISTLSRTTKRC
ncbi:hypothetical protein [Chitinimonas sp. BJYL2]|uniref:hypothetical protein n=1 Tax=Chitinimonas sp. BJYL2 TaxID=2976696 RepID=UPI0022B33B98|nr:hypothetical protein [Chitinimonas sp. BJYL2]